LFTFNYKKFYESNFWTPHSTIALNVLDKELEAVIKTIKTNLTFPIITTIDKVIITRYDVSPGEQIAVFNLKK